jgi:hypothetical protein
MSFVLSIHARAPHTHPPSPRRPHRRFSATGAPSPRRTPSERYRHPPPPVSAPSELLHSSIDRHLLTPRVSLELQDHPPSSMTTGATPPPLNTAARRRLRCLTIDPPLRCAPAPSSLPGTSPMAPSISPATPCRQIAAAEPPTSAPPHRPACGACALPWAA